MAKESHVDISSDDENRDGQTRSRNMSFVYEHRFGSVELHGDSLKCLKPNTYLNDNIIQFYSAYLLSDVCPEEFASRIHIFDSIFHDQLNKIFTTRRKDKDSEEKQWIDGKKLKQLLNKWLSNIDIFEKHYLIFPICMENHWFAIVVCHPSAVPDPESSDFSVKANTGGDTSILRNGNKQVPGIIVMDSLQRDRPLISRKVRMFLDFAWREKLKGVKNFFYHNLNEYCPVLPRQTNAFDCGLFVLAYIRCFIEQPERFYRLVRKNNEESNEMLKTKAESCLQETQRESIRTLIHKVMK